MRERKGKLVVFEGIDHTGKTTQIELAEDWLRRREVPVERYREPGGTETGERIRGVLLERSKEGMLPLTEVLLFFASRVELAEKRIVPALESGHSVILDRYWFSTAAYQGPWIPGGAERVVGMAVRLGLPQADAVVCLDGDPVQLARRAGRPPDRIEAKGQDYMSGVRAEYAAMAGRWPWFHLVDAMRAVEEVHSEIVGILDGVLGA